MEEVSIHWSGPFTLQSCLDSEQAGMRGIYTVTRVFGYSPSLLYIGESYYDTIWDRLYCHNRNWVYFYRGQMQVNLGNVQLEYGLRLTEQRTKDIEGLLIYYHQPIHNTINKMNYWGRNLCIINRGRRGLLSDYVCTDDLW